MSSTVSRLVQPGHVNLGIKPYPLTFVPSSTQVYFNNGLPCRCRLQIPIDPDVVLDYLSELEFDQVQIPWLNPGLYQIGFNQIRINDKLTLRVHPIMRLDQSEDLNLSITSPIVPKKTRTI